ncbi:MAG TPA: pyruvate kinase, partial [Gemmatimonadaceae bacterium]
VEESDGTEIRTTVVHGDRLGQFKGINAPGVALRRAGLTAKDLDDLRFGVALGVDVIAMSFVQSGDDVRAARRAVREAGGADLPIVAKLERPEAITRLEEILETAEAVMVARGDLGLELPLEQVPRVQKEITRRARALGRPVIVATEVLDSMRTEPRPTRAEVSDAANAVDDGVDAIMLSGETAIGRHPVRVVETLASVILDAERLPPVPVPTVGNLMHAGHGRALCEAAVTLADRGHAEAIVAVTREGNTARMLASLRPDAPIVAATPDARVARRLVLYRGVFPLVTELGEQVEVTGESVGLVLRERGWLRPGDDVVFVSAHPDLSRRGTNFLALSRVS